MKIRARQQARKEKMGYALQLGHFIRVLDELVTFPSHSILQQKNNTHGTDVLLWCTDISPSRPLEEAVAWCRNDIANECVHPLRREMHCGSASVEMLQGARSILGNVMVSSC